MNVSLRPNTSRYAYINATSYQPMTPLHSWVSHTELVQICKLLDNQSPPYLHFYALSDLISRS